MHDPNSKIQNWPTPYPGFWTTNFPDYEIRISVMGKRINQAKESAEMISLVGSDDNDNDKK